MPAAIKSVEIYLFPLRVNACYSAGSGSPKLEDCWRQHCHYGDMPCMFAAFRSTVKTPEKVRRPFLSLRKNAHICLLLFNWSSVLTVLPCWEHNGPCTHRSPGKPGMLSMQGLSSQRNGCIICPSIQKAGNWKFDSLLICIVCW